MKMSNEQNALEQRIAALEKQFSGMVPTPPQLAAFFQRIRAYIQVTETRLDALQKQVEALELLMKP